MTAPKVFVSYSHDSKEHKEWVSSICTRLVKKGVDIILDQWEIGFGDDLPKFMERSVKDADRVLMICTEAYVAKADDGYGGVGYESMVVTGEIVRNLGTSKFIPVVRQTSSPHVLPTSVSTRFYVDLSNDDDDDDDELEDLLREIHQAPASRKPTLGQNPFALTPSGREVVKTTELPETPVILDSDGSDYYSLAMSVASSGNVLEWRKLAKRSAIAVDNNLPNWFSIHSSAPTSAKQLGEETMNGIKIYSPMFAHALAGVASGRSQFSNQISLIHDILQGDQTPNSGLVIRLRMPESAAYVYQALHGAVCIYTMQPFKAIELTRTHLKIDEMESKPVHLQKVLVGWPKALDVSNGKYQGPWELLCKIMEHMPWLQHIFTDETELQIALNSYYLLLNIQEYALFISNNSDIDWTQSYYLDTPLVFTTATNQINTKAYRLLLENKSDLSRVWSSVGISNNSFAKNWSDWINVCRSGATVQRMYPVAIDLPHENLVNDLSL